METARCMQLVKTVKILSLQMRHCSVTVRGSKSGQDGFLQDFNSTHLNTSPFQRAILSVGSAVVSLADPRRGDMIAAMGETTGNDALEYVKDRMADSKEGNRILSDKPRITSTSVDFSKLRNLPAGTVGKAYADFMDKYNYSPDERLAVRFVDDVELAYVIQRYREVHDLFHTILGMPTNMLGEVTVKWVEAIQTRLPMCIGGAIFGATRLAPKYVRNFSTQRRVEWNTDEISLDDASNNGRHSGKLRVPCVSLPEPIMKTITKILKDRGVQDLSSRGSALTNYLHSRKPPVEDEERKAKRKSYYEEVMPSIPVNENMSTEDVQYWKKVTRERVDTLMWSRLYNWHQLPMDDLMCHEYLYARTASEFAVLSRVFNEIRIGDPSFSPKNVFDFGSGVGTVNWCAHSLWESSIREYYNVESSPSMNDLALLILQQNKPGSQSFIKNVYQRQFLPATPRQFDMVVSAYTLFELNNTRARLETVSNLWNKTANYLVLIEQGTNAGFQLLNEASSFIQHLEKNSEPGCHIFAPCPHDLPCPRLARNDGSPCNFHVKYIPLSIKEKSPGAKTELFSFVIIKRDSRSSERNRPRIVREVLLRHKHAICRFCTEKGNLDEVIFTPGKHGKPMYKCAKRLKWGDVLPVSITAGSSEVE